ncbi:MAG TPA: phosphoesterase, partial [Chloroflexota bacterium]|nr:phosphoesterase [Chloroflexota bacterium]
IGGHVNATDAGNRVTPAALAAAIRREVAEEVALEAMPDIRYIGVINSNLGPVEQVHLGIVAVANLPAPIVTLRDPTLADGRFDPLPALTERLAEFETWSKLCIEALGDLTP